MSRRYESIGDMIRRLQQANPQDTDETDEAYDLRIQQIANEESDSGSDYDSDYVTNYDSDDETYGEQLRRLRAQNPQGEFLEGETDEQYEQRIRELAEEEDNGPMENLNEDNAEQAELIDGLRAENPRKEGETNLQYQIRIAELAEADNKPMGYGECPICFEPLTNKKTVVDAHPSANSNYSGHNCHKNCLLKLCGKNNLASCPLCRADVDCNSIKNDTTREVIIEEKLQGGKRKHSRSSSRKNKRSKKLVTKKRKGKKKYTNKKRKVNKKRRATKRK